MYELVAINPTKKFIILQNKDEEGGHVLISDVFCSCKRKKIDHIEFLNTLRDGFMPIGKFIKEYISGNKISHIKLSSKNIGPLCGEARDMFNKMHISV